MTMARYIAFLCVLLLALFAPRAERHGTALVTSPLHTTAFSAACTDTLDAGGEIVDDLLRLAPESLDFNAAPVGVARPGILRAPAHLERDCSHTPRGPPTV